VCGALEVHVHNGKPALGPQKSSGVPGSNLLQGSNRLDVSFDGLVRFIEFPVLLQRIVWPMNPRKSLIRGPIIHNENLAILLKRADIMVISIRAHKNHHNLSLVQSIDTIEGRFGKGCNVDIDSRPELKSLFRTSWGRQGPFKFPESLRVKGELLLHPSDQIFVGFPAGHCFSVAFTLRGSHLGCLGLACFCLGRLWRRGFGGGRFRWRGSAGMSPLGVGFYSNGFTGKQ